ALDGGEYPASAEAVVDSELVVIDQESFQQVVQERPAIALHLMRTIGRRLRRLVNLIEQISFKEVVHRLADYLLSESERALPFQLATSAVTATRTGTLPALLSRSLGCLPAGGAVAMQGRTVVDVGVARLRELANSAGR